MAESLYLRLPTDNQPASWLLVDALGNRIGRTQHGPLAEAATQGHGRRICVLIPGNDVSVLHADIPTRNVQKVLQALPYALEDRLAEDVEGLHFALGNRRDHGYHVAVLRRSHLNQWLTQLAEAGLTADELVPATLALPQLDDGIVVLQEQDEILARLPNGIAFSADPSLARLLIQRELTQLRNAMVCDNAVIHTVEGADADDLTKFLESLELQVQCTPLPDGPMPLLVKGLRERPAINLLQGEFSRHTAISEHWQRWRFAVGMLVVFCVVAIAQQATEYLQLRHQAAALDTQVIEQFHQALPEVHRVVNPRVQIQQRLNQLSGGNDDSGPLPMLALLGSAMQASSGVHLKGFNYQNGTLQVEVNAAQIQALDDLKTALQQSGKFNVNLDSVNSNNGQATGRLTLTGNAS